MISAELPLIRDCVTLVIVTNKCLNNYFSQRTDRSHGRRQRFLRQKSSEHDPLEDPRAIHYFKMFSVNNQTQSFTSHTPHTMVKLVHMDSFLQMISAASLLANDPKCLCKCKEEHLTMLFCRINHKHFWAGKEIVI